MEYILWLNWFMRMRSGNYTCHILVVDPRSWIARVRYHMKHIFAILLLLSSLNRVS
jgi:hypothetical protein